MTDSLIPEGFRQLPEGLGFNDALQPMYYCNTDDGVQFGLLVERHHCNAMGTCHGGVLMTFMDTALSGAVCHALGKMTGLPTINMGFDFLRAGKPGDWLVSVLESTHFTRTLGFAHGLIVGPHGVVARANGCFRLPAKGAPAHDFSDYQVASTNQP